MSVKVTKDGEITVIIGVGGQCMAESTRESVQWFKLQQGFIVMTPDLSTVTKYYDTTDNVQYLVVEPQGWEYYLHLYIFNNDMKLINNLIFPSETWAQIEYRECFKQITMTSLSDNYDHMLCPSSLKELVRYVDGIVSSRIGNNVRLILNDCDLLINYLT